MTLRDPALILYTTVGCHLCEQARDLLDQVLAEQGGAWRVRSCDIADAPELIDRYGLRIPVLRREQDGAELGWPFDHEQLSRWLQ